MYFKRLEMHGFKSFAEPVVIEFHEGVTCIVGPNGSGKSNISDAIRWVLGEQSPKALRGGKMEEVIFSGTASRKSRGMAEVTLVIDNSTGLLPIDYNEVAITRRMYRSGESEYLINNNQCRLRDIRELIMDTGIGVDGYSIIGQGRIADIVSSKPENRREIFEESAGVVLYKSKKAEAERKLESTVVNLDRIDDIIGEIESRIDGLREDSTKAQEYLQLKERRQDLEINITLRNIEKRNTAGETMQADISRITEAVDKLTAEKQQVDKRVEENRDKDRRLEQLINEARDKLLAKVEEINEMTNKSQLSAQRLSAIEEEKNRLDQEIRDYHEKLLRELANQAAMERESAEIGDKLAEAEQTLQQSVDRYNRLTAEETKLAEAVDGSKNEMYALHTQATAKRSEAKSMESLKASLEKRRKQICEEGDIAEADIREVNDTLRQRRNEKEEAEETGQRLLETIQQQQNEQMRLQAVTEDLHRRGEDLRIRKSQLESRKRTIEEMEANYEGYNSAVRFLMRANRQGIHGVVADLMKVPIGYETAIETVLGAAMQNIVCDSDGDAKAAIRLLKEKRAGRCTFLPLESVRGSKAELDRRLTAAEGFKGLAVDCITFAAQYAEIFHMLLGRVVIIDNMDHAVSLSKRDSGLRYVTLDGEIINRNGAITGGKYKNATANLLERKQEIQQLGREIETIQEESQQNKAQLDRTIRQSAQIEEALKETEDSLRQTQLTVTNLRVTLNGLEETGKEMTAGKRRREKEMAVIDDDLLHAQEMAETLLTEADAAEQAIRKLNMQIDEDMAAYEKAKMRVARAGEEITQIRIDRNQWNSKMESCKQLLARVKAAVDEQQLQIDTKTDRLQRLDEEAQALQYGSTDVAAQAQKNQEERQALEQYIADVGKEREELSQTISRMTATDGETAQKLNKLQDQKYQMEMQIAKNDTQLDLLKEKLWEEFEVSYMQALAFKRNDFVMSTAVKESREIRSRMRELGDVNVGAIKEYEQVSQRYTFLTEQRADVRRAMEELQTIINDMDKTIRERFKENFDQVVVHFESIFKELFGGGHAELRLDDENDPLQAGIEIIAQPPGKKLQNINLMSGGEKTMTAIALMFAVLKTKPTPFCILDEVEAALDDANIDRFATYLRKFKQIQFAVVTHQKATMEHADVLYGVTMPEQGISKVLSLRLGDDFAL